uniref:Uncharacterized protein n=2 Tax=Plectus sambesii TaxID=2011161 RepID=A0A914VHU1_9BILA
MVRLATIDELDLPPRLMRAKTSQQARARDGAIRRSKSQPMHSPSVDHPNESDDEFAGVVQVTVPDCGHIARLDTLSSDVSDGSKPSFRSSVHSTSSSMTTASASSDDQQNVALAEAAWDHVAMQPDELPFAAGDVIKVLDWSSHPELWFGSCHDRSGWFPASHVRLLASQTADTRSKVAAVDDNLKFPQPMRTLRSKIVQELVATERDYVNLLQNLVEGFLHQARRRIELFPAERLRAIFGNLEAILALHQKLLTDLESYFLGNAPENSCVGDCFLRHQSRFTIYSEYCNNRPVSCAELANLSRQAQYHQFFEACRLLRGMPKLSLEGFLLTPVQRICKYPLQLAELLKATPDSHPDRQAVEGAYNAMRAVASDINDRKRRLESLQKIAAWQYTVEGWRGPDLLDRNSAMLHSGELTCRCMINGSVQWTKEVVAFLFDQTLILCKRDLLKRNLHIFKDRVSLDAARFVDIKDGKDANFGVSVKHAWKLVTDTTQYLFSCRDRKSKRQWVETFEARDARHQQGLDERPATNDERRLVIATIRSPLVESNGIVARKSESQLGLHSSDSSDGPMSRRNSGAKKNSIRKKPSS